MFSSGQHISMYFYINTFRQILFQCKMVWLLWCQRSWTHLLLCRTKPFKILIRKGVHHCCHQFNPSQQKGIIINILDSFLFFGIHSCLLVVNHVDKQIVLSQSINAFPYHFCCLCLQLCVYEASHNFRGASLKKSAQIGSVQVNSNKLSESKSKVAILVLCKQNSPYLSYK